YRQLPELLERGHVYIACAPLYKVKLGNHDYYFEKDAQLEDLLSRERIPSVQVTDRQMAEVKFTETRWNRLVKEVVQYDGYFSRRRSDFGAAAAELMVKHRLVEHDIEDAAGMASAIEAIGTNGYELSIVDQDDDGFRMKLVEIETSTTRKVVLPVELLASPI